MQVARAGATYLASSVINKAVPLLMLPVLTRYLTPDEFGIVSVFVVINGLVSAFVGMAMHTNIATNFYTCSRAEIAALVGNILIVLASTTAAMLTVVSAAALAADTLFSVPAPYLLLMPLLAFASMVGNLNTTILRSERRPLAYAAFEIGHTLVYVTVTMVALVGMGLGWRSQVAGLVAANVAFLAISMLYLARRQYFALRYDPARVRAIMRLSLPLVPHILGGVVIGVSDRLFIEKMVGLEAVALYAIGYSFGMAMSLVTDATMKAWTPWVYRLLASPTVEGKRQIVRSCYAVIAWFLGMGIAVALAGQLVLPFFVTDAFLGAEAFVAWVTVGYAVRGIYQVFFPFLVHIRRTGFLAISTTAAALLNLVLNYVLIDAFGAIGAAYATIAAFAVMAVAVFWYQKRNFPMPWTRFAA